MVGHGLGRDGHLPGDLCVAYAGGDEAEHLAFPVRRPWNGTPGRRLARASSRGMLRRGIAAGCGPRRGRRLAEELTDPQAEAAAYTAVSLIAGMRGDEHAAEQAAAQAERVAAPAGANITVAFAQFGRVVAGLGSGRYAGAYNVAKRLFDPQDPAYHPVISSWLIGDLAEAGLHPNRVGEARAHVEQVGAAAPKSPGSWIALGLDHARAVLADDSEAEQRFQAALSADFARWPFQRARTQLAYGQWLRRGDGSPSPGIPCGPRATPSTRLPAHRGATRPAVSCHAWIEVRFLAGRDEYWRLAAVGGRYRRAWLWPCAPTRSRWRPRRWPRRPASSSRSGRRRPRTRRERWSRTEAASAPRQPRPTRGHRRSVGRRFG